MFCASHLKLSFKPIPVLAETISYLAFIPYLLGSYSFEFSFRLNPGF